MCDKLDFINLILGPLLLFLFNIYCCIIPLLFCDVYTVLYHVQAVCWESKEIWQPPCYTSQDPVPQPV